MNRAEERRERWRAFARRHPERAEPIIAFMRGRGEAGPRGPQAAERLELSEYRVEEERRAEGVRGDPATSTLGAGEGLPTDTARIPLDADSGAEDGS